MNFQWARSTKLLALLLAIAVVVVGVLTALVMRQRHDLSTVNGQVRLGTAPAAPGASVPAGADIVANPNVVTRPDPAAIPDSANPPVGPVSRPAPVAPAPPVNPAPQVVPAAPPAPAPGLATTHITPALVVPAPRTITPPGATPPRATAPRHKPVKPVTPPARRADPLPAPQQPEPAVPVTPAPPQTDPDEPTESAVPVKPGKPDDSWAPAHTQVSDKPAASRTDLDTSGSTGTAESSSEPTKTKEIHHKAPTPKVDDAVVPCPPKPVVMNPGNPDPGKFGASDLKAPDQEDLRLSDQ